MRHLHDCDHWYHDEAGDLIGGAPRRATDAEMLDLVPCADCQRRAEQRGDPADGVRGLVPARRYWWASQGENHAIALEEQTLWTYADPNRRRPLLSEMQVGDVVLHYGDRLLRTISTVTTDPRPAPRPVGYPRRPGQGDDGWLVEVNVDDTTLHLSFREIQELISPGPPGPLDKNGTPRRNFIARLTEDEATRLIDAAEAQLPSPPDAGLIGGLLRNWGLDGTDSEAITQIRREQGHLRASLLRARATAPCDVCGRELPATFLVAAHIVPRRDLTHEERLDFASAAMLACALGCDSLFECGYIVIDDDGRIARGRPAAAEALLYEINALIGRTCLAFNGVRAPSFARHRGSHLEGV
ncbi:hypothetical protein [Occultella kanbiaonis]|uniref:hypothetical protein n=1 Tax=Occultella kanbiaonis TaxID=2675754 RepID=UPI0012B6C53A|nr:hypothetical protein [Occultella kanbiaonis]